MNISEALVESKTLRDSHIEKVDVLEKVKNLALLPDDVNATVELAASYFEVGIEAIKSLIKDNREEVENDGVRVIQGDELRSLKDLSVIPKNTPVLTIIPRRAMLRIGMLLKESKVAQQVRDYLLNVEVVVRKEAPHIIAKAVKQPTWNKVLSNVKAKSKMYQLIGFPEPSAIAHALSHEEDESGVDLSGFKRHVRDEDTDKTFTPTELGKTFEPTASAQKFNQLLEKCGLQVKNIKNEWELTEKGKPYAKVSTTVIRKKEEDKTISTEKLAIRWKESVVGLIQPLLKKEDAS